MKKAMVAALLGASLLAGSASASQTTPGAAPGNRPPRPDPMMRADANKDGILTRDEVIADVTATFSRIDANKDGTISPDEREAVLALLHAGPGGPPPGGPRGRRGPGGPEGPHGPGAPDGPGKHRMDGPPKPPVLTIEEAKAQALRRFDRIDTNHDGKIDAAEREAAHQRMREMRMRRADRGPGDMPPPPPPPPPADASN
ncbi:ca2+ sensor protein [Sphingomonas sp. CJ20]